MSNLAFFDIDTQYDFIDPGGALYMKGAERILSTIRRLLEYATRERVTTISTMDAHIPDDPEFQHFPPHCVAGTPGQKRLLPDLPALPRSIVPVEGAEAAFEPGHHYVVEKQALDVFSNPWLRAVVQLPEVRRLTPVVFGVATDYCVWYAVHGICEAGMQPRVVTDAIRAVDASRASEFLNKMVSEGATLATTEQILSGK